MSKRKLEKIDQLTRIFVEVWIKCFKFETCGFLYVHDIETTKIIIDCLCDDVEKHLTNKDQYWQKLYEYAYRNNNQDICTYILNTGKPINVSDIKMYGDDWQYNEFCKEDTKEARENLYTKNALIRVIYTWLYLTELEKSLLDAITKCGYEQYIPVIIKEIWESGYDNENWMCCMYSENLKPKTLFEIEHSVIPLDEIVLRYHLMLGTKDDYVERLNIIRCIQAPFNWSKVVKDIYTIDEDGTVHNYGDMFLDCIEVRNAISQKYKEMQQ